MILPLQLTALALLCYFGGLLMWKQESPDQDEVGLSKREFSGASLNNHRLVRKGAEQVDEALALVQRLDSGEACLNFARSLNSDLDNRLSETLWKILLSCWSQLDPEGMIAFLASEKAAGHPTRMEGLAWKAWGASDPEAAFAQIDQVDGLLVPEIIRGIAMVDPDLAIEMAFKAPEAEEMIAAVLADSKVSLETIARLEEFSTMSWIEKPIKRHLAERALAKGPAAAMAFYRKDLGTAAFKNPDFLIEMAREKPLEGAALLDKEPPSRGRAVATVNFAKDWAQKDPAASLEWVRQQSSPQIRQSSLVAISSVIGGQDPLAGLALIDEIGWTQTGSLSTLIPVENGRPGRATVIYPNQFDTIETASSLFRTLAATSPSAARRYLEQKVPVAYRSDFETILQE